MNHLTTVIVHKACAFILHISDPVEKDRIGRTMDMLEKLPGVMDLEMLK